MKPDWDQLMDAFNDSPTQLVADVDCTTSDGKPLCDSHGIRGFPTIKYGDPSDLQDYQGGRDYDSLKQFADDNLRPVCSPTNIHLCDDDKRTKIETYQAMSSNELDSKIAAGEKKLEDAEEGFKEEVQKLQHAYERLSNEKDEKMKAVEDAGLGLMKSCKVAKIKADAKAKADTAGGGDEL
mmetsp:Transcript_28252/g.61508  ORF Transcript_28252/g.61508 Transcript_28252/m.61508 type:complete len:181 (+) Transcript_28252:185-727(+)